MDGALTGDPSATLTIQENNGNSALGRMRLYGNFTNNANVVLVSGGTEMEIATYAPSNSQIFNGVISGNFGRFVPRTAAAIIFNNTNTFNDINGSIPAGSVPNGYSVLLSSGFVGIGADSVSSTPPIIDASPIGTGKLGINVSTEGGTCGMFASGGSHTLGNVVAYTSTTNTVTFILGGTNNLTLAGEFDLALAGDSVQGTNRTLQVTNTAATTISGIITDNSANNGVVTGSGIMKTGNGSLYLNG